MAGNTVFVRHGCAQRIGRKCLCMRKQAMAMKLVTAPKPRAVRFRLLRHPVHGLGNGVAEAIEHAPHHAAQTLISSDGQAFDSAAPCHWRDAVGVPVAS